MPKLVVLISGSVSAGKSTLSDGLRLNYDATVLKTKQVLRDLAVKKLKKELPSERKALQQFGTRLDKETNGEWVRDALKKHIGSVALNDQAIVVVDAVRILPQVKAIRRAYGFAVKHVHLQASSSALTERYELRRKHTEVKELPSYSAVEKDETEARISELLDSADFVIDTERCTAADVLVRAATHLGLYARNYERLVDVYVGGQYGSEGKGHIISYVAREYDYLVRVGGPNAGHKVYQEEGAMTHRMLPSGTLRSTAKLLIGAGAVLNVPLLLQEIADCRVSSDRLRIDGQAMILSESDVRQEGGLKKKIGSTKQGVGAATARRIMGRDKKVLLARDIKLLEPFVCNIWEELESAYSKGKKVLLEGTQGTALSLYHGRYPYVTSRDTTVAGCLAEAGIPPSRVRRVVLVCRTYPIRVANPPKGTSGFMENEIDWGTVSKRSKILRKKLEQTELSSVSKKLRRVGEFDWGLLRKTAALNGPTDIALTFADYLHKQNENARRFEQLHQDDIQFIEEIERVAAAPVSLISTRFDFRSIIDRRAW